MNVLVTGGTGFVGNILINLLCARSDRVTIVTRSPENARTARVGVSCAAWLPDLSRCEAIVNLAGADIAGRRWNEAYKAELVESRVERTRQIVAAIARSAKRPRVLVSASAVGFYGDRGDDVLAEDARAADDFLGDLCERWEAEALAAEEHGVRVVVLRLGVVLGRFGGVLQRMVPVFKLGLGGPLGSGRAWFPWIHVNDAAGLMLFAIDREDVRGPLNAVAPGVVTSRELARTLGRVLARPALLPVPRFVLRLTLGEVAGAVCASLRVVPRRAQELGYGFAYPELEPALRSLLHRH